MLYEAKTFYFFFLEGTTYISRFCQENLQTCLYSVFPKSGDLFFDNLFFLVETGHEMLRDGEKVLHTVQSCGLATLSLPCLLNIPAPMHNVV